MKDSKTYCPLAWVGLNILPNMKAPCCFWAHDNNQGFKDIDFDKVRTGMLEGKEIPNCVQCYEDEKLNRTSRRLESISRFGYTDVVELKILDISFDNLCNLKCRGCASTNSHLLYSEEISIYGKSISNQKYMVSKLDGIDFNLLEEINVSGGEPFLSQEANNFFKNKKFLNLKHLGVVTNATVIPQDGWSNILNDVDKLSITLSIDGVGKINDYFRSGSDFDKIVNILDYWQQKIYSRKNKTTNIIINTTVNIYNVNMLNEIDEFFKNHYPEFMLTKRELMWPNQLSIKNIPLDLKDRARPYLEKYPEIIKFMDSEGKNLFDHFINYHNILNDLRKENLKNSNPWLYEYIQQHKSSTDNSREFFVSQIEGLIT